MIRVVFPISVKSFILIQFSSCDPTVVLRSKAFEVDEIVIAPAYFTVVNDGLDNEFGLSVDINRAWFFESTRRKFFIVVGEPWFDVGEVEGWEKIRGVRHVDGDS